MTIDAVTLPSFAAGATLNAGQQFVITGSHFDRWPDEIVLGYDTNLIMTNDSLIHHWVLLERTPNRLVFTQRYTETYQVATTWNVFGSPNVAPRTILDYDIA